MPCTCRISWPVSAFAAPEARSALLLAAFRREVLTPLPRRWKPGARRTGPASGGNAAEQRTMAQRAEMPLAALVGLRHTLSLRRGKSARRGQGYRPVFKTIVWIRSE